MTMWKRAPRSVYSVYGEQEYLCGDASDAQEQPSPAAAFEPASASRWRALVGLGLLAGVTTCAVVLVAVNVSRTRTVSPPAIDRGASVDRASAPVGSSSASDASARRGSRAGADRLSAGHSLHRVSKHDGRPVGRVRVIGTSVRTWSTGPPVDEISTPRPPLSSSVAVVGLVDREFGFER
jgi:hypothetical protein